MSAYSTKRVSALESQWIGEKGLSMQRVKKTACSECLVPPFGHDPHLGELARCSVINAMYRKTFCIVDETVLFCHALRVLAPARHNTTQQILALVFSPMVTLLITTLSSQSQMQKTQQIFPLKICCDRSAGNTQAS